MLLAARNIVKAWLLVLSLVGIFALVGWLLDGVRGLSIFVFCALLVAAGAYWTFDRVALGMIGARELPRRRGAASPLDGRAACVPGRNRQASPLPHPRRAADRRGDRARRAQLRRRS